MNPKSYSNPNYINVRQEKFPLGQWTITTRKGIIMQSKCTCKSPEQQEQDDDSDNHDNNLDLKPLELCDICRYHRHLPHLHTLPDMLFNNNLMRLEHYRGFGIEFNPLDALRSVQETKDPLKVAVADGWQSARSDCPFASKISRPFDWTFTTNYSGTFLTAMKHISKPQSSPASESKSPYSHKKPDIRSHPDTFEKFTSAFQSSSNPENVSRVNSMHCTDRISFKVEETDERIDINKLKVREEILFYDDVTLYEDELADHGIAQYTVKVRVMPNFLFILARYYLRIDGVLARINDTRLFHELKEKFILREYTNREAKLSVMNLPLSTMVNPNELMNHLPLIESRYEKLIFPEA